MATKAVLPPSAAERLRECGEQIWGADRWIEDMATALKVKPRVIRGWASGAHEPPGEVWERLRQVAASHQAASLVAPPWGHRELVWAIHLPIKCSDCGHETSLTIAMLKGARTIQCGGCGGELDLRDEKVVATITKLWEACRGERLPIAPVRC